jgi:1-acyl-sn-glycerol-3-phosphate acyltransferase
MPAVRDLLVSIYVWGISILILIVLQPVFLVLLLVTAPFDPGRRVVGGLFHWVGRFLVFLCPTWDFRVENTARAPLAEPGIIVANHQSDADVFLAACLPWEAKFLSKDSLYNLPVMGWAMRMAGDIGVVRGDRESGAEALDACRMWIGRGVSVVIFPEGTRSRTSEMLPFYEGAFRLAVEMQRPLQPVAIAGTRDAMKPGSFVLRPARAGARILDPVPVTGLTEEDVPALTLRVRETIEAARRALARDLGVPEGS